MLLEIRDKNAIESKNTFLLSSEHALDKQTLFMI